MRTSLIAANWKMNNTEEEALYLVRKLIQGTKSLTKVEVLICPPFTSLSQLFKLLVSSPIQLGAQNISDHDAGAYTGEISPSMAAEFCSYVILGHSERRAYYGESDALINRKTKAAQRADLTPILCVGEQLDERERGQAARVITRQLQGALQGVNLSDPSSLVIAYEPVWAIGSGLSASPAETADFIGGVIRPVVSGLWGQEISQKIRVLYGGSVSPENAGGFFTPDEIDGALVGGASLSADSFLGIIEKAS